MNLQMLGRVAILALTGIILTGTLHANITVHGSTTAYEETGGDWLTMGTNDIDGSGGLGTDGFFFFGDFNGTAQNGQPFTHHVKSVPSYVSGFAQGADWAGAAAEYSSYGTVDDPILLDGTNGLGGVGLGTTGGAGTVNEVITFTVAALPAGTTIRVGVLAGVEANPDGRWDPTSITLSDGTNSVTVGDHGTSPLPANPGGSNTGWVFFDIDADGTYAVAVTKSRNDQGAGIGGLTFDSLADPFDLFDPTDSEPDGMGDNWETVYFGDLSRDGTLDFDSDGRSDLQEWGDLTNPTAADIDGDGLDDGQENALGTDPLDGDSDDDGWGDGEEVAAATDPNSDTSIPTLAPAPKNRPVQRTAPRDSVVVFNEIHYQPAGDDSSLEFVELHNQFAVDIDMSNWRLAGDVDFDVPEGTVIAGGGYLVIARDPAALAAATGYSGAFGPFTGMLSNSGGHLYLYNNNRSFRTLPGGVDSPGEFFDELEGRRIMDEIDYSDVAPWPIGADGSGSTLAKRDPGAGTPHPHHWAASVSINGTPGLANPLALKPSLAINELSATTDANFRVELFNYGAAPVSLDGMIVASSDPMHPDHVLPAGTLAPGAFLSIDAATLGFTPADNNRVFLYGAGRQALVDAARADDRAKARHPDGTGRWARPDVATFDAANSFDIPDEIVINEILYHAYPEHSPFAEREEEWIELYNRGGSAVSLTGWTLEGGIGYEFPDGTVIPAGGYLVVAKDALALAAKHPAATIIGDYSNRLGNGGDVIYLEDPNGNIADEVEYFESGKWHQEADGRGSSLELRDPDADNAVAGAWAPSDESARTSWQTYSYEGVATEDGIGDQLFHELQVGLLDAGEFLIDDVSVLEGNSLEFIQNGDFEGDTVGAMPDTWRVIGTHGSHGRTVVITDPDDPGNQCLQVVATGPTENKHNKIETTFANGEEVVVGNTYRISFRAKWLGGSSRLNTRLYFNYLQRTHVLETPVIWGTPGLVNTAAIANAGPDLSGLAHSPVVPDAGEAVTVSIDATDAGGIDHLTLFYSVNDGAYQSTGMSVANGRFAGMIPGQDSSDIVRFYVQGTDSNGAISHFPEAATGGGAFFKVQDGLADTSGLRHNFRIIMAESDRSFLFLDTNRMSNDRFPVTIIENEETVYYDAHLRLKASAHGRYNSYGFNIRFQPDQLFRGVHSSLSVERGSTGTQLLAKFLMNRAGGGQWSFYDDVAYLIPPTSSGRGVALLSLSRHTASYWDGLFPGSDENGTLFNLELHYNPTTTAGGPEDLKIGNPYTHTDGQYRLEDRGDDQEAYRWGFQIRSARDRDDYSQLIALNQAVDNLSGGDLKEALDPIIDVDQWMRTFAMMALNGNDDIYGRIWEHNFRFFVRPTDGKIIVMQWDLDRTFRLSSGSSLIPTTNKQGTPYPVAKLFEIPEYRRMFDGHLDDLIQTTFNSTYVNSIENDLATVIGSAVNESGYVQNRANYAQSQLPGTIPFTITTNGGNDFAVVDSEVDLEGTGWVDVFSIKVNGLPVPVTWTDADSWQITVPVSVGPNLLDLTAYNNRGTAVGTASITVTNGGTVDLAGPGNLVISELHYHPATPSAGEMAAGFTDQDWFEFIEFTNVSATPVDLNGCSFTDGIEFDFPGGTILAPGERVVIVSNQAAFELRYGVGAATIVGEYVGNLRNSGERIRLEAADTTPIADFTYGDALPWPDGADGGGYSLVLAGQDPDNPFDWRMSTAIGGNPSGSDSSPFFGGDLLAYSLASKPTAEIVDDTCVLNVRVHLGADDAAIQARFSTDLVTWTPATAEDLISRMNHGDGTATFSFRAPLPPSTTPEQFGQVLIEAR